MSIETTARVADEIGVLADLSAMLREQGRPLNSCEG